MVFADVAHADDADADVLHRGTLIGNAPRKKVFPSPNASVKSAAELCFRLAPRRVGPWGSVLLVRLAFLGIVTKLGHCASGLMSA
jgi:hypothetical protein